MPDEQAPQDEPQEAPESAAEDEKQAGTATKAPRKAPRKAPPKHEPKPAPPKTDKLPPYKVLLHNDDHNEMVYVVLTIVELTPLREFEASRRMFEAHLRGLTLLLTTHKERAELYRDQFKAKGLKVTIEPA